MADGFWNSIGTGISNAANTVGDYVGLDGNFGAGGSNKSYSVGGLADSFSNSWGGSSNNQSTADLLKNSNNFQTMVNPGSNGGSNGSGLSGYLSSLNSGLSSDGFKNGANLVGQYLTYDNQKDVAKANATAAANQYDLQNKYYNIANEERLVDNAKEDEAQAAFSAGFADSDLYKKKNLGTGLASSVAAV